MSCRSYSDVVRVSDGNSWLLRLCSTRFVPYAILHAAMSEKLAVVRRWVELYNERTDVTEFLSLLDPEVELQTPGGPRLRRHDQASDWFETNSRTCSRASSRIASSKEATSSPALGEPRCAGSSQVRS